MSEPRRERRDRTPPGDGPTARKADRPLSYWTTVARLTFEDDFHRLLDEAGISQKELADRTGTSPAYISKVLKGEAGNFQIETMAKLARAVDGIVQIHVVKDGREVTRVMSYREAARLDDRRSRPRSVSAGTESVSNVLHFEPGDDSAKRGGDPGPESGGEHSAETAADG